MTLGIILDNFHWKNFYGQIWHLSNNVHGFTTLQATFATPVLLLSRPEYSEVALESGKSGNFVA